MCKIVSSLFHLLPVVLVAALSPLQAAPPTVPTNTRLVDFFEQMGVDTPTPRFGWVVNDPDRGEKQTAYQIVVADGAKKRLWDSGKVTSAEQFGVVYKGLPLAKTSRYLWTVRTWDKDGEVSPWSELQSFVTSFFKREDWSSRAQWIRHPDSSDSKLMPVLLRKKFAVTKPVRQAYLYVCGLGQFVGTLNGKEIGDHEMDPSWTDYDYTVNYVTFDVTAQLAAGQNALGLSIGPGWLDGKDPNLKPRKFGPIRALAQLHIQYTDGSSEDVVTDTSWKAGTSPFLSADIKATEVYDARMEQPGWDTPGFNDSKWVAAVTTPETAAVLATQSAPPQLTHKVLPGKFVSSPAADSHVYDFGQNMNAQFSITVQGEAGQEVTILSGEFLNKDGTVNPSRAGKSIYTLKGGGPETWRQTFGTIGMRYVQVSAVSPDGSKKDLPRLNDVTGYFIYSASKNIGSFEASDPRYNQIRDLVLNALRSNLTSIHTDCPNLEKLGWQEVVWTLLSSYVYQHDVFNIYSKLMWDTRDSQRTFGMVPTMAPNYFFNKDTPNKGMYDDTAAWGSSLFHAPWHIYQTYGDKKILADNYDAMKRYLAYLKSKEKDGVIRYGLGDWMAPAGTNPANVDGGVYVMNTRILRDTAQILGEKSDAELFGKEYIRVRDAYNKAFFDTEKGRYNPVTQGNQAMPLSWGIVPEGREQDVAKALVEEIANPTSNTTQGGKNGSVKPNHISAGDVGNTFLWRALGDAGQQDLVQTMIMQPESPSYMSMINAGETALAENWNLGNIRSHNHDMLGGIFEWLYRTPGGISGLEPGYARIQLKPGMPNGLTSVTASSDSVRGLIGSAWKIEGDTVTWDVKVPVNSTARICVPARGIAPAELTIQEGSSPIFAKGAPTGSVPGLAYDKIEKSDSGTFVVWNAGSGNYRFTWPSVSSSKPAP
ncbi:MAG: family 78 glycoside hydrolase catalytic domain [Luteolibacter sp.]